MEQLPRLRVSPAHPNHLETEDGLFFMLGDTAWELLHKLNEDEVSDYLDTRAEQGFNMPWIVGMPECDSLRSPNRYGLTPLHHHDPRQPNEEYWDWVERVIQMAAERGMYIGFLPTWADKMTAPWGDGPRIFHLDDPAPAYDFGRWVGERFAEHTNLLWVMGGDRPAAMTGLENDGLHEAARLAGFGPETDWRTLHRAMAQGVRDGAGPDILMTYHPQGGPQGSATWLADEPWIDLHAFQSGHGGGRDERIWEYIESDLARRPLRPTFDAEPCYEDHPVRPWPTWDPRDGYFCDYDVRRTIYRSIFAGACGVVYGHHSIWHFAGDDPTGWVNHSKMTWREALVRPGARHVGMMAEWLQDLLTVGIQPAQDVFVDPQSESPGEYRVAARIGQLLLVYLPHGGAVTLRVSGDAYWFDPRTGQTMDAGVSREGETLTCIAPNSIDWVLVVES